MTDPVTPEEARKDAAGLRAGGDPWPAEIIDSLAAQLEAAQKVIEAARRTVPYLFNSPLDGSLDRYEEVQAALVAYDEQVKR